MAKTLGIQQFISSKKKVLDFTGSFDDLVGKPELTGAWIVWGNSANGKTRFTLKLAKYLTNFGHVAYNSLEEGDSLSLQRAFIDEKMSDVAGKLILLDGESLEELTLRLEKRKSPDIIVIDSLQYFSITYKEYKELKLRFKKKLFIFISHADGSNPKGSVADKIRYDANCKIRVEGFRAFALSRYGGGTPYTIWTDGAVKYWGEQVIDNETLNHNNNDNTEQQAS